MPIGEERIRAVTGTTADIAATTVRGAEATTAATTWDWTIDNPRDWTVTIPANAIGVPEIHTYTAGNTYTYTESPRLVTTEDLNKFANRIYEIISEHAKLDISEEEFMNLLKE